MNKPPIPTEVLYHPNPLDDAFYTRGVDFPLPDSAKGLESGSDGTVPQSEVQKSPRQNAQSGPNKPTVKGREGRQFPTQANGVESDPEQPVFAGQRSDVGINLASGQVVAADNYRLKPEPLSGETKTIRANVRFKKAASDIKEDKLTR